MSEAPNASGDEPVEADAESAAENDSSLTTPNSADPKQEPDPRAQFLEQFTEEPRPIDEELAEEAGDSLPEAEPEEEPPTAEPEEEPPAAEPEEEPTDLSEFVPEGEEPGEEIPEGYNPKKGLPSSEWKKLPKSTRDFITHNQKYTKKLLREKEQTEPVLGWAQQVLSTAEKVEMPPEDLSQWIELGLRMQRGETEAVSEVVQRAQHAGYTPPASAPAKPKLDAVVDHLNTMVEDLVLSRADARSIMDKIKEGAATPEEGSASPPAAPPSGPAPAPVKAPAPPMEGREAVERAALKTLVDMEDRLAERHGEAWPKLRGKIRDQMILENARTGRVSPQFWPERYRKVAGEVEKEFLQTRRSSTVARKQGSESLGGSRVPAAQPPSNDPRTEFLRKYTM